MSLQSLNEEYQLELVHREKSRPKARSPLGSLRMNNIGGLFRRRYPEANRLEEMLLGFD